MGSCQVRSTEGPPRLTDGAVKPTECVLKSTKWFLGPKAVSVATHGTPLDTPLKHNLLQLNDTRLDVSHPCAPCVLPTVSRAMTPQDFC